MFGSTITPYRIWLWWAIKETSTSKGNRAKQKGGVAESGLRLPSRKRLAPKASVGSNPTPSAMLLPQGAYLPGDPVEGRSSEQHT